MSKYSQSQRAVMALYRRGLRLIRTKPEDSRYDFTLYLRHFFRHPSMGGGLSKRDFTTVEYMMRRANKMLDEIFANPSARRVRLGAPVLEEMHKLGLAHRRRTPPSS
ncbi:Similar to S.cerevisiae protein SDH6 (Mitochondrial protein involved in assembly of succinate dehydrogenase) [Malassezia sympodialis ATCC 42132]|uniref:Similar to S.cerevisiae protein SDH6 (Mitochondrial protein involved in assembly of succinate dehydrogenase) n=1 Tax=Malassezia sympodialis (strain ATCC 42132) TaxID=1230383 RepID=A0A1M8ABB9_MALS4|nr:Similar to S.cerevisiae protein SDH6 (Mitochondrial protein involved in assembly of succinate dehydrogenase) [Malassezia sympodialis ATCC 42132]